VTSLERLRPDHADAVLAFELANRSYFTRFVGDRGDSYFAQFADHHAARVAEQEAGEGAYFVLVEPDGSVIGRFNLVFVDDGVAELGYRMAECAAGRGVATATVKQVTRIAFSELGIHTVCAATSLTNAASQRVLVKAGFRAVGPADPSAVGGQPGTWFEHQAG
jgi:ribosomal-protein-alanine N-acetyltransferase